MLLSSFTDVLSAPSGWRRYLEIGIFLVASYLVGNAIYNIFLHPLRKFPGPKLWAASRIPFARMYLSGTGHLKVSELHAKYGPIVRVAPTELIFCYPEAYEDIMGHRKKDQPENSKDPDFWVDHKHTMIGATRENHGRHRRILAHGFSNQAMVSQQPLIQGYISLLMQRLKKAVETGKPQEMTSWYNWTTFDIIGHLSFGEPFGCLEKAQYHPWISIIFNQVRSVAFTTTMHKFPFSGLLIMLALSKEQRQQFAEHFQLSQAAIGKRLAITSTMNDFVDSMITAREKGQMSDEEILHNTQNLVLGGSETTATSLSAVTYLLATHKDVLTKLQDEVRNGFDSEEDITLLSVQKLDYMLAILEESLRVFPAVPPAIPRITPPEGAVIRGEYIPPKTMLSIWQWSMAHSPEHFKDPESFIPERWLGDPRFANDKRQALQPFSWGPRNCIGKNLAYAEMRLIMARLVWNFDIELDPQSEGWTGRNKLYLLWDKPNLFIRLKQRMQE